MYMGLKGKVYDVTKSRMLGVPGEHYAKIWAGKVRGYSRGSYLTIFLSGLHRVYVPALAEA